jgi:hypothetical protein
MTRAKKPKSKQRSKKPLLLDKRNRKSRKSAEVYCVKALFANEEGAAVKNLALQNDPEAEWIIEGGLEQFVIVSVPPATTMRLAEGIRQSLVEQLQRPVLLISHNISLLSAERLEPNEAAVWLHKMEKFEAMRQEREKQALAAQIAAQSVEVHADDGTGCGSGLCVDGFGNPAPTGGNGAGGNPDAAGGDDETGDEKDQEGSSSLC